MSNPTHQEIIDAYKTLEYLIKNLYDIPLEEAKHTTSYERLAKFLPPKPRPTMADVEWDNDKHYLAEAEVGEIKLVMLQPDLVGWIRCFDPESGKVMPSTSEDVTPTGRRYTLTEVQE